MARQSNPLVLFLVLLIGVLSLGPGVAVAEPDAEPHGALTVSETETDLAGVVTDQSGAPLAGVKVDAWTWCPGNETVTDEQGRFRLTGFDPGEVLQVQLTKDNYSPAMFTDRVAGTLDWEVVLTQGTWLEGRVLSPTGEAVPDALVRASRGPFRLPQVMITEVTNQTTSDADGRYRLYLESDTYDVQVRVPGVGVVRHTGVKVDIDEEKAMDLKLTPGVQFEAFVQDSVTGKPVAGIVLYNWRQREIEGVSNRQGRLVIDGMVPGEFEFGITGSNSNRRRDSVADGYARWWSPQSVKSWQRKEENQPRTHPGETPRFQRNFDGLTFDLQGKVFRTNVYVEPCVTLKGRVLDPDGNPVEGATVAPAKTGSGNSITGDTRYSYTTDTEGQFTVRLPASHEASYNLVAHDGGYKEWRNWANGAGPALHTRPGEMIEGIELRLTQPCTVRGRVTDSEGRHPGGVDVRAISLAQNDNRYYVPSTKTDAEGRYELRFVAPGAHQIQASPFWGDLDNAPSETTRRVDLAAGAVEADIDLQVVPILH